MAHHISDPEGEEIPVRDTGDGPDGYQPISEAKERQIISRIPRDQLEDRYLRLREEHSELKKLARQQEEKMKLMATKLLRLVKDRKRIEGGEKGSKRDVESTEIIEDLESKVRELEKQNEGLKSKVTLLRQQLQTHGKRQTPYDKVKPRVNTGLAKTPSSKQQRIQEQMRLQGSPEPRATGRTPLPILAQPRYGHSLLEESRIEKRELEDLVSSLQEQIQLLEQESETLREQLKLKQLEHEEEMHQFRSQMTDTKRANVQENIELIRLQRELKEKGLRLQNLQDKYQSLEQVLTKVKKSHEGVLEEMEALSHKLSEEQAKNSTLKAELRHGNLSQQTLAEKEGQIDDLKAEISVLKEAHSKLLHSAFDAEKDREFRQKERSYQVKIAQLEAEVNANLNEKNDILDKLTSERALHEKALKETKDLEVSYYTSKEELDDLRRKLNFFSKESKIDFAEIQEALLFIQSRKENKHSLDFLEQVDEEVDKDLRKETQKLQAAHADTINELEKTRSMLVMQHKINLDYQSEVERLQKRNEELRRETDSRLQEYAQLLDIRASRIKKLESQLRDVAYGTKQYKITEGDEDEIEELDATVHLERGQNVFEIHIGKMHLSPDCLRLFQNAEPQTFVTYEFFEYELQSTPVVNGEVPDFNFTSQYVVQVDDFFLHYLQKEQVQVELHRAIGTDYSTIAIAALRFDQMLNSRHGRVHGTVKLFGLQSQQELGSLEYWTRLRVPMEQALRLFKERTKALGYITSGALSTLEGEKKPSQKLHDSEVNELRISVHRCYNLKCKREDAQPSCYVVYKFFDFADHDTAIVPHSNAPVFDDIRTFPVPMTAELDSYLKSSILQVYVFDDEDPETTSYVGLAQVPLVSLSQDKAISGTFELKQPAGAVAGLVDLSLKWLYSYIPAMAKAPKYPSVRSEVVKESTGAESKQMKSVFRPMDEGNSILPKRMPDSDVKVSPSIEISEEKRESRSRQEPPAHFDENADSTQVWKDSTAPKEPKSTPPASVVMDDNDDGNITKREALTSENETESENEHEPLLEELRKTAEMPEVFPDAPPQDTIFEEDSESEDDLVYSGSSKLVPKMDAAGSTGKVRTEPDPDSAVTSESESVVVSSLDTRRSNSVKAQDSITVIVSSLTLFANAEILRLDKVKQLFVCYKFLDIDPEELETPFSLPKPPPNRPIYYNFKKVFHFDGQEHNERRQQLAFSLTEEGGGGRLYFTVVSEPGDEDEDDCEDLAVAYVDFIQMLRSGEDVIEGDLDVVDLHGSGDVIGALTVTVEALEALRSLYA